MTSGLSLDTATLRITLELVVSKAPKSALPRCVYVRLPSLFRTAVPNVKAGDARLSVLARSQNWSPRSDTPPGALAVKFTRQFTPAGTGARPETFMVATSMRPDPLPSHE